MNKELLEDNPLLVLTTVHAYAINDFDVEDDVKKTIIENRHLLKLADPEKVYKQLEDILMTPHPARYIREFKEVFFEIIPGLKETYGFKQNNTWHIYDVFEHTMHVIENTEYDPILRIAALFHDLGKPKTYTEENKTDENGNEYTVGHFYQHAFVSRVYFERFAEAANIPKDKRELIEKLIIMHDYHFSTKPEKIQKYIDEIGAENMHLLISLQRADNLAQNPEKTKEVLEELDKKEKIIMDYIATLPSKEPIEEPVKKN